MNVYLQDPDVTLYHGDALETLRQLPAGSVDCVVTSPPYWGLRDYGTGAWEGGDPGCDHKAGSDYGEKSDTNKGSIRGGPFRETCGKCGATRIDQQLGLEATPDLYVARMVGVFREVWRVLADHGTCWVNMGSSYFQGESYPLRPIDAAWLAAIIDGEGSIQVHQQRRPDRAKSVDSFQVDLGVGMMTPEVVQRCHEITGLGSCKLQNRGVWDWSVRGQQAAQLLRAIYPYLIGKRKQAALAVMLADDLAGRKYGRGNPAQPDVMEWRAQIKQAVSDCNQRIGTDFPIVEPRPIALGLKPKDDVGTPHRLYFALRDDGWYARMDVVWGKLNPMPESVTDRPTKSHEYVFLLSKRPRYFFDQEAVREPHNDKAGGIERFGRIGSNGGYVESERTRLGEVRSTAIAKGNRREYHPAGRNVRSVWEIATQPYPEAHFATFPEELARRCILAGTSERGKCPECGAPWWRQVVKSADDRDFGRDQQVGASSARKADGSRLTSGSGHRTIGGTVPSYRSPCVETSGWEPSCTCRVDGGWGSDDNKMYDYAPAPIPCVVLDPFVGSGTVCDVARKHGRHSIGVDLNDDYLRLAARRLQQLSLLAEAT